MATTQGVTSALATSLPHSVGPEASKETSSGRVPLRMRHPDMTGMPEDASSDSDQYGSDSEGETTAVDDVSPDDNYVRKVLAKERPLPPIKLSNLHKNINLISTLAITLVPAFSIYGALTTEVKWQTVLWAIAYYFYTGLGITAGKLSLPFSHLLTNSTHLPLTRRLPSSMGSPSLHRFETP